MALPSSGEITIADIWTEYNGGATPGANENISLGTLSTNTADGGGDPDAMSEFYGLSAVTIPDTSEYFAVNTYVGTGSSNAITEGKIGTAANFNGSSSYIELSDSVSIATGNNDFSLSAWVYLNSMPSSNACVITTQANYYFYILIGSDGKVKTYNGSVEVNSAASVITTGQWYHIVATLDSTNGKNVYVNGSNVATSSNTGNCSSTSASNMIGVYDGGGINQYYLDGKIDQVRIFDKALSSSEVTQLAGETYASSTKSTTDIFNDGSGIALYEFGNGGIDTGGIGKIGNGAIFDGSTSHIEINSTSTKPFDASAKNFTISAFIYVHAFQNDATLVTKWGSTSSTQSYQFGFQGSGNNTKLIMYEKNGSSNVQHSSTTSLSANTWYHVAFTRNQSQAFIYINGVAETFSATNSVNTGGDQKIVIGRQDGYSSTSFNGIIDQVRFFNSGLTSTQIGELAAETSTSSTKSTADFFGNGTGVTLYEFGGSSRDSSGTVGDTIVTLSSGSSSGYAYADSSVNGGKYYWEVDFFYSYYGTVGVLMVGAVNTNSKTTSWASGSNYFYYAGNGNKYSNGSNSSYSTAYNAPVTIGVKLDMTNGTIGFTRNGTDLGTAYSGISGYYHPAVGTGIQADKCKFVFDSNDWKYSAPSGYSEWTAQITSPIIAGGGATAVQEVFSGIDANMNYDYSGIENNVSFEGMNFKPDLVWINKRAGGATRDNMVYDSVRGAGNRLRTNQVYAESYASDELTSFDSNGFTLSSSDAVNGSTSSPTYAAWCWKAAGYSNTFNVFENGTTDTGATASNVGITAGTNTNGWGVSANRDSGFSIVKYTGNGSNSSIGHGLSVAPELVIIKSRGQSTRNWITHFSTLGSGAYLMLNSTAANASSTARIASTTSTVVNIGTSANVNANNDPLIMYCFHSVDGIQKIGTYDGGGIGSANEIITGFRPRFLLYKAHNNSSASWGIYDGARYNNGYPAYGLYANTNDFESSGSETRITFTSTGWYWNVAGKAGNVSGRSYVYLAVG